MRCPGQLWAGRSPAAGTPPGHHSGPTCRRTLSPICRRCTPPRDPRSRSSRRRAAGGCLRHSTWHQVRVAAGRHPAVPRWAPTAGSLHGCCKARDGPGGHELPVEYGLSVVGTRATDASKNLVSMKKALNTVNTCHAPRRSPSSRSPCPMALHIMWRSFIQLK